MKIASLAPIAGMISLGGIELHVEAPRVEVAHRLAKVAAAAVGGVAVGLGLGDGLLHRLDDQRRRRAVGVADAEADHVHPRGLLGGDLALQFGKQVRRDAAQALTRSHVSSF